jgi:hypothetical protein
MFMDNNYSHETAPNLAASSQKNFPDRLAALDKACFPAITSG